MRRAMGEQAISLAKAVGYNSAGQYYKYILCENSKSIYHYIVLINFIYYN
jgi:acetyl/propionyl-CoA carboxylase alpha subunit